MRTGSVRKMSVTTTASQVVPSNATRVALIFSAGSGNYTVSTDGDLINNAGLVIPSGAGPFTMTLETHGALVQQAWSAIAAGAVTAGYAEVIETAAAAGRRP